MYYVLIYLTAIVAANLSVAHFGPASTIVNAFLFIGLDLTSRDKLHDSWHKKGLWWKMCTLILCGSLLSYLLNKNADMIAVASFVAFLLASIADTLAYHFLRDKKWTTRVNGSNVVGSAIDSAVFPLVAFGAFLPWIVLGQFLAKMLGGLMWSLILRPKAKPELARTNV